MKTNSLMAVNMLTAGFIALLSSAGCASQSRQAPTEAGLHSGSFQTEIVKTVGADYLLYLPPDYGDSQKEWPLILFLHGSGERGRDLSKVEAHGPPKLIAKEGKEFPFIIVSPQCPADVLWASAGQVETLNALLDNMVECYRIDTNRVYGTALSIGADGMGALAAEYPDRFAALALICGGVDPKAASRLADVPVWSFHGEKDNYMPIMNSKKMVAALKKAGCDVKFTSYPDAKHDAWTETFENDELYSWLLSHSRADDEGTEK